MFIATLENNATVSTVEHNLQPNYRPDIDGLRALAIIPVVAYHAFPSLSPGGFVGVDIFFVISGFLISTILYRSFANNDFSFTEFYAHRIRRIFPALILVMVSSFVFGWFVLLPDEYAQLGKHVAAGAGFVENYALWREAGYFDVASELKPLMHLWSLAIEEQFYLLFPLIAWLSWRGSISLIVPVVFIFTLSFIANVYSIRHDEPALTFFAPHTRFWELMVGAILAWRQLPKASERISTLHNGKQAKIRNSMISAVGLCFILASVFFLDRTTKFPGEWALLPVLGTALVIVAGTNTFVNKVLLSNRPVVFIGKISYPLYLWHWPLLAFGRILSAETPSEHSRLIIVIVSVALAALTYRYIEKPIRYGSKHGMVPITLVLLLGLVGFIGYNCFERNGLNFRLKKLLINNNQLQFRKVPDSVAYLNNCVRRFPNFPGGCMLAKNVEPTVALIGDSHSLSLFYGLADITRDDLGINVLNLRRDSALLLKGVGTFGKSSGDANRKELAETELISNQAVSLVAQNPSIQMVILVSRGPFYISNPDKSIRMSEFPGVTDGTEVWRLAMRNTLVHFQAAKKNVAVVIDWPELNFDPRACVDVKGERNEHPCGVPRKGYENAIGEYRRLVISVTDAFPNVKVFDSSSSLCDENWCTAKKDGHIFYSDTNHLSLDGARHVGEYLLPIIRGAQAGQSN